MSHLNNPRSVVPGSVMPRYRFLADARLDFHAYQRAHDGAAAIEGVPYSEDMIDNAQADLKAQPNPDDAVAG